MKLILLSLLFLGSFLRAEDQAAPPAKLPEQQRLVPAIIKPADQSPDSLPSNLTKAAPMEDASEIEIKEVLVTSEYVLIAPIDPLPYDVIRWEKNSAKFLYIAKGRFPFIYMMGSVEPGLELSLNNKWVRTQPGGRFEAKVNVPLESTVIQMRLFKADRTFGIYRFNVIWLRIPPSLRARVKEGDRIFEKSAGFIGELKHLAFSQLYAKDEMVSTVDIDTTDNAKLTFRIFMPPEPEPFYDSWAFVVKDSQNRTAAEVKRLGNPPNYLEWGEIKSQISKADSYTYQMVLFKDDQVLEGASNRFDTIEGNSLLHDPHASILQCEPRQEIGFFEYSDQSGFSTINAYMAADIGVSLWNRLLVRMTGLMSLHSLDQNNYLTFTRVGTGIRLYGAGESEIFGTPNLWRLDLLMSFAGYTVYESAPVKRYTHMSAMLEPHFVLWKYHYFVPMVEFSTRPNFDQVRWATGLSYYYFIRPWSLKLGFGFQYDTMTKAVANDAGRFKIIRGFTNFTFFL